MDNTANPEGLAQPSGCPLATTCWDLLSREVPGDPYGRTVLELVAQRLMFGALRGDVRAAREIREVVEGPMQRSACEKYCLWGSTACSILKS